MQTAANISLILTDSSSFKRFADSQAAISYGGFYQLITSGVIRGACTEQAFRSLGDRLVVVAEHAHAFRRMDLLDQVSQILMKSPLPRQYEAIGQYYQALCIHRFGRGDVEQAALLLEPVALDAPLLYRIRALRSLGANSIHRGNYQSALSFYCEADRLASDRGQFDLIGIVRTQKDVAVINSLEGNHRHAAALLENLFPVAQATRLSHPHVYYHYMNSLAVELCEVGRLEEAKNVSQIVLASPLASAYPEWRDTREEIELRGLRASRSTVAVSQRRSEAENLWSIRRRRADVRPVSQNNSEANNLIRLPVPEHDESLAAVRTSPASEPARVLSIQEWTEKMHRRSSDDLEQERPRPTTEKEKQARLMELSNLDTREMMMRVMTSIADDVSDDQLFRALIILEGLEPGENQGA